MKRRVVSILLSTVMAVTLLSGCKVSTTKKTNSEGKTEKKIGRGCNSIVR